MSELTDLIAWERKYNPKKRISDVESALIDLLMLIENETMDGEDWEETIDSAREIAGISS
jgi:hypothetical protein